MIILTLMVSLFLFFIALVFGSFSVNEDCGYWGCILYWLLGASGFAFLFIFLIANPSAKDVYRGKTELRITYDGNIPIDTTVIYKRK